MDNETIPEIRARAKKCEADGDVKGWTRAMRKLSFYENWADKTPESIPVTPAFYKIMEDDLKARNEELGNEVVPPFASGDMIKFRGIPVHPEVLVDA